MLTVALALLVVLLAVALVVVGLFWRDASRTVAEQTLLLRHQVERINGYRAELDALSIAGPPPAAAAALTPDAEPPLPRWWLDDLHSLPTTHEREYRR